MEGAGIRFRRLFQATRRHRRIRPLTIAVSAAYLAIAWRYWFYVVVIVTGAATVCFTLAAVLSA
ncbi:MAG: hypothetical protein WA862_01265 [Solirubrobacterales bacterium]